MRFLIDTHVLIWYLDGSDRLPENIRDELNNESNTVVISIASLWELAIKLSLKKIDIKTSLADIETYILTKEFSLLNISLKHINALSILPTYHRDPFDRLLISQAITEDLTIISADQHFKTYPISLIW